MVALNDHDINIFFAYKFEINTWAIFLVQYSFKVSFFTLYFFIVLTLLDKDAKF